MKLLFYPKLAAHNIKNNRQTYLPYILTCVFTVAMFYIMCAMSLNPGLSEMRGADILGLVLRLGDIIIGIFSVIFLFYTNSFLMKRRKKEIGLYNILGMTKGNLAKMLTWEYFFVGGISILLGLLSGALLSRLMYMLLEKLLQFTVPLKFELSAMALLITAILFLGIFICTLLSALLQLRLSKPVELLSGGSVGEREPKTKWLMTLLGILTLGAGYWIAMTTESPIVAILLFFVAVILVIIGTYLLFTAGSIAFLKLLRKKKSYYYKTKHFISVSGMIYRMKQNAAGLASICILSTCMLVSLSTTVSLYAGMEDVIGRMNPYEQQIKIYRNGEEACENAREILYGLARERGVTLTGEVDYGFYEMFGNVDGADISMPTDNIYTNTSELYFVSVDDYNRVTGQSIALADDEILLYEAHGKIKQDTLNLFEREYKVCGRLDEFPVAGATTTMTMGSFYIVLNDTESIAESYPDEESGEVMSRLYYFGFETGLDIDGQKAFSEELRARLGEAELGENSFFSADIRQSNRETVCSMYGGLMFLGIFLGALFLVGTVLIIYYKQISEGLDDKRRFDIMQKVGMSRREIRSSVNSQILIVFFFPLITAAIHVAFSFKFFTRMLSILALTNTALFALCTLITVGVFAIVYIAVYALTSNAYYKIVR